MCCACVENATRDRVNISQDIHRYKNKIESNSD